MLALRETLDLAGGERRSRPLASPLNAAVADRRLHADVVDARTRGCLVGCRQALPELFGVCVAGSTGDAAVRKVEFLRELVAHGRAAQVVAGLREDVRPGADEHAILVALGLRKPVPRDERGVAAGVVVALRRVTPARALALDAPAHVLELRETLVLLIAQVCHGRTPVDPPCELEPDETHQTSDAVGLTPVRVPVGLVQPLPGHRRRSRSLLVLRDV